MTHPKIVRPRSDSARLPLTVAGTALCLAGGWFLGVWVFKPSRGGASGEVPGESVEAPVVAPVVADAGAPARPVAAPRDAGAALRATAVVRGGVLTACGDGEETNLAPASCDAPAAVEVALRARLSTILGACPSAATAARDPSRALSIGLRVDFPRRRVSALLGRSSSVPDKVSYVACVNATLGAVDEVWRVQAAHPRYLYFFTARFSPTGGDAGAALVEPAPAEPAPAEPATPAPATPAPAEPATPAAAPAVADDAGVSDPTLPTVAQMLRMPAMATATVAWATAIVRETPRTGPVVARVPQGTEVEVVDRRGSWYGIRWARTHVGWTYGDAIGQGR